MVVDGTGTKTSVDAGGVSDAAYPRTEENCAAVSSMVLAMLGTTDVIAAVETAKESDDCANVGRTRPGDVLVIMSISESVGVVDSSEISKVLVTPN